MKRMSAVVAALLVCVMTAAAGGGATSEPMLEATIAFRHGLERIATGEGAAWGALASWRGIRRAPVVVRIDPSRNAVARTTPIRGLPRAIAVAGGAVWVAADVPGHPASWLWRIDPRSGRVVAVLRVPSGVLAAAGDEKALWLANGGYGDFGVVWRIDPSKNRIAARIPVSGIPSAVVVTRSSIWVARIDAGLVSRIDPATNKLAESVPVDGPFGLAAAGDSVWVLARSGISEFNAHTGSIALGPLAIAGRPSKIATGFGAAWVTTERGLVRVDASTGVTRTIRLRTARRPFAIASGFGSLWITNAASRLFRFRP